MRQPSISYSVNSGHSNSPTVDTEILPGYTLTLTYHLIHGDYVAVFNVAETDSFKPFVSSPSYNAVIKALVEQLGILACAKAKLISINPRQD